MIKRNLAPVAVFCYNRLDHIRLTIGALKNNLLAENTELFIFSDGPKNERENLTIKKVRKYLASIKGFKKKTIICSKKNLGLRKSIVEGVSLVLKKRKKIIVLEDDMVTSKQFIKFMNFALNYYKDSKKIFHISSHSHFPVNNVSTMQKIYFSKYMNCWGWATWEDRWKKLSFDKNKIDIYFKKKTVRKKFDYESGLFWRQIESNFKKKTTTWAIFWYASIFMNNGLCVNPYISYTKNIGMDGTGMHTVNTGYLLSSILYNKDFNKFVKPYKNLEMENRLKETLKLSSNSIYNKVINRLSIYLNRGGFY